MEAGVQPRVSTGRSIHAVAIITPSPGEGIEDGPRTARLPAKLSGACALHPVASGYQPQDHIAVALPRSPQGTEPINHGPVEPDQALPMLVGLVLESDVRVARSPRWRRTPPG